MPVYFFSHPHFDISFLFHLLCKRCGTVPATVASKCDSFKVSNVTKFIPCMFSPLPGLFNSKHTAGSITQLLCGWSGVVPATVASAAHTPSPLPPLPPFLQTNFTPFPLVASPFFSKSKTFELIVKSASCPLVSSDAIQNLSFLLSDVVVSGHRQHGLDRMSHHGLPPQRLRL